MKISNLPTLSLLGLTFTLTTNLVHAIPPIPDEGGWSGHIGIGVGAGSSESNMLAGISSVDLGDETISSLTQGPDDEDVVLPSLQFEVAYTFEGMGTQLYLGNAVADHLNFDLDTTLETHFGARQDVGELGVVNFSYAASALPTDVWKDPYIVGDDRGDTERTSSGIHIVWDRIFGMPLEFAWSAREIEIDDERSALDSALGLTADEQRLLRRTGDMNRIDLNYEWKINDRHSVTPGIGYVDFDLDGDAMAEDGLILQLKYVFQHNNWRLVSKAFYEDLESDETNPIYGKEREVETIGASIIALYEEPFGLDGWAANAGVSYYEGDSNINFYDSSFGIVSFGMRYTFE